MPTQAGEQRQIEAKLKIKQRKTVLCEKHQLSNIIQNRNTGCQMMSPSLMLFLVIKHLKINNENEYGELNEQRIKFDIIQNRNI